MALNAEVLTSYKKIDEAYIDELLKKEIEKNNKKIVVLDDDPTGVQTVHDISVYTNWEKDTIRQGFDEENNLFYVLTNSRDLQRNRQPRRTMRSLQWLTKSQKRPEKNTYSSAEVILLFVDIIHWRQTSEEEL